MYILEGIDEPESTLCSGHTGHSSNLCTTVFDGNPRLKPTKSRSIIPKRMFTLLLQTGMISDVDNEMIIVNEYGINDSLDGYLEDTNKRHNLTQVLLLLLLLLLVKVPDLLILKTIKQLLEMRDSVCHSATIYANALMHAGTTVDTFLRENLDWLSKTTNWSQHHEPLATRKIVDGSLSTSNWVW
ncbi:26S proteasome non-ATPase regulatory subunit 1 homolog A-like protein [Tanacetum coccineum]